VRALNAQAGGPPLFIVPLGLAAWMQGVGVSRVVELDWWERHTVRTTRGEAEVMLTPARHWSARTLLGDRMQSLWGGFAVLSPSFHLYYSGDTGYDGQFKTIAQRLAPEQGPKGFDLALIPIGAYLPRWFMQPQHVDPTEAVQIHQDVRSQRSLGVHWGTFDLGDEPTDQAPQDLALARQAKGLEPEAFKVLAVGQTWRLPRRR